MSRTRDAHLPADALARASFPAHVRAVVEDLHPASFALVMATGIVAIASHLLGLGELSAFLQTASVFFYAALWVLLAARAILAPRRLLADLASHARAPGFFTVVAATGVVGSQVVLLGGHVAWGRTLWWACIVLWATVTYTVFTALTVRRDKPGLAEGINGGWLVAVVATQAVCVLGATVRDLGLSDPDATYFLLLSFWLCGGMLYIWIIGLIFQRYMFHPFSPRDLMPPYWVNMGAVAISTLAGVLLLEMAPTTVFGAPLRPFVLGLTLMFWATATWWIPMLVVLGVWRHLVKGVRVAYDLQYWGLVFPLGMYATCTYRLADVLEATFLLWIARVFVVAAACAWLLTFLGLAGRLLQAAVLGLRSLPLRGLEPAPVAARALTTGGNGP